MKYALSTLLAATALVPSISAHYCFNRLIVDGNVTSEYEYVRKNNNSNSPVTDVSSNDLRCNSGGLLTGNVTSTYEVAAGSSVGFALDTAIGHPGPLQVYMSKADTTAAESDGSGDWFKVYEMGTSSITSDGLQWASSEITNFTFTLPDETPAGEYLLRAEHIALHGASTVGGAQFYISCAQIKVTGSSTATPSPDVAIPGVYTGNEPGLLINIYWPIPTNYTMPGPAVWPSDGSSNSTTAVASSVVASSVAASSVVASSVVASSVVATSSAAATSSVNVAAAVSSTPAAVATPQVTSTPAAVPTVASTPAYSAASSPLAASTPASTASTGSSGTVQKYGQCGGTNYSGTTECESGSTCKAWNDFYSQCV